MYDLAFKLSTGAVSVMVGPSPATNLPGTLIYVLVLQRNLRNGLRIWLQGPISIIDGSSPHLFIKMLVKTTPEHTPTGPQVELGI